VRRARSVPDRYFSRNLSYSAGAATRMHPPAHPIRTEGVGIRPPTANTRMARKPLAQVGDHNRDADGGATSPTRAIAASDRDRLVRLAYRFVWNHDEAEDAVQDALLLARSREEHLCKNQSWWSWVRRILINRCHERGRKRNVRNRHEERYGAQRATDGKDGSEELAAEEARDLLRSALHALPRRQREVLVLRHIEGLPFGEVGELLEMAPGTARVHARAGREALREILAARPRSRPENG